MTEEVHLVIPDICSISHCILSLAISLSLYTTHSLLGHTYRDLLLTLLVLLLHVCWVYTCTVTCIGALDLSRSEQLEDCVSLNLYISSTHFSFCYNSTYDGPLALLDPENIDDRAPVALPQTRTRSAMQPSVLSLHTLMTRSHVSLHLASNSRLPTRIDVSGWKRC